MHRGKKLWPWKDVFFDHLVGAIDLLGREVKDIFILEHLDCGAYKKLHPDKEVQAAYAAADRVSDLRPFHETEAHRFAKDVRRFCRERSEAKGSAAKDGAGGPAAWADIRVHCLLMDLRGDVTEIDEPGV
jgi:hypothetical protein